MSFATRPPRFAFIAAIALAGCGGDEEPHEPGHHAVTDAGAACDDRADAYAPGLSRVSPSGRQVALLDSEPSPPAKGDNTLTVQITGADRAPLAGLELTATPFMPDHGHGTPVRAAVTELEPGTYVVSPVNLWMPGYWELTLVMDHDGEPEDVAFSFCIHG